MYIALKHSHLLFIALSICSFIIRFIWTVLGSKILEKKWVKTAPHIIDTGVLLSGIGLIYLTKFMPFSLAGEWLTEKLFCVIAYIALGFLALHPARGMLFRLFAFCGALGWLYLAATLALTKTPYY